MIERRRNPIVLATVGIIVLGLAVGGAFTAGRIIGERDGAETARQEVIDELQGQFDEALALLQSAQTQGTGQQGVFGGGGFGGGGFGGFEDGNGTIGVIEAVESDHLTVLGGGGGRLGGGFAAGGGESVQVFFNDQTVLEGTDVASPAQLQSGQRVVVVGEQREDGGIDPTQITVLPAGGFGGGQFGGG